MKKIPLQTLAYPRTLVIVSFALYCVISGFFLTNDFWQDEIYTIVHFILPSWKTLFFDYHTTNNHIAFNAVVKIALSITGRDDLRQVIDAPALTRSLPYVFGLAGVMVMYSGAKKHYGRNFALTALSIMATTMVMVDFSTQLRGYSMSILCSVVQYFAFLDCFKAGKFGRAAVGLFLVTALSLLCLPTNIYLNIAYLFACAAIWVSPNLQKYFLLPSIPRLRIGYIFAVLFCSGLLAGFYYLWLLTLQPANALLLTTSPFAFSNLVQGFAVFFHFTGVRIYFYAFLLLWLVHYFGRSRRGLSSQLWLPAFLFVITFVLFFVHGAIIIQRTFLSLLPVFVLIIASAWEEVINTKTTDSLRSLFYAANMVGLVGSFFLLQKTSVDNNVASDHKQDLANHYYLINFNAREVTATSEKLVQRTNAPLYLLDGFGETGVQYYLKAYNVPFRWFVNESDLRPGILVLTNNKKSIESALRNQELTFKRFFSKEKQYCIYLVTTKAPNPDK